MSCATVSELLDALDNGERLLLPNARAARELRSGFDTRQRGRGLLAWEPPKIQSWSQWANSQWSELVVAGVEGRLLLNAAQEESLWREIIAEDHGSESFGSADSLAELAGSAWQLAASYRANQRLREFAMTHDSRTFAVWADAFSKRCAARDYLSVALLDAALLQHMKAGALAAPGSLTLLGFGELLPSQRALVDALRERGADVFERGLELPLEQIGVRASVVAANAREELRLAGRWIRGFLEDAGEGAARVAVLVPNLTEDRAELDDVLRETLAPELQSIDADLSSKPWEFSGGVALSSLAMIADTLVLARWSEGPLPLVEVSSLLLSPYVGKNGTNRDERDASAQFDAGRLRRMLLLRPEIGIASLLELADQAEAVNGCTPFAWLRDVHEFLRRSGDREKLRGFAEWMEFVRGLTRAVAWPGNRALTALEFEATRAWESMLDLVSTLDFSGRRVGFAIALQALQSHAEKTVFAPPTMGAPVQVMSVAEAEGSVFDAVVFLHATDANWPASERQNPLLPGALQRSLKMPGTDSGLGAAKSRAFTEGLMKRSGSLMFTYAAEDESGKLRPSPLLAEMGIESLNAESIVSPTLQVEATAVENVADDDLLPALPSHDVAGGATVLKLQAACGFFAFAELRLHAKEQKRGDLGLDAGECGNMLHRVLQSFWKTVVTQDALRSMSRVERDRILVRAIDEALPRKLQVRNEWDRSYLVLQKERMRSVLQRWLDEELRRGPFTVLAVEQEQIVAVGPLTLKVRMDRIDKVGDGVFFVDYKTGYAAHPKHWEGERPDEPQLPLYTLLPEVEELKGVAFAKVRTGRDMKWIGYQAEEGILPVAPRTRASVRDMAALVEEWRGTLTRLAEEFAAGRADVRPKSFEVNCARCAQRLLCRIDPALMLITGVDEGQDVDG